MSPPAERGSLTAVMDRLQELAGTVHPTLAVYRWWRPDMSLPALFHWLTPGNVEGPRGVAGGQPCDVRVWARITVSIMVDPAAVAGEGELLELEAYHDLALPVYAGALYERNPLGQREARIRGAQTVADEYGGVPVLSLELPLEVALDVQTVPPTP